MIQKRLILFYFGWLLSTHFTNGQSLLVGIPSADVAKKGHFEFTHESQWGNTTEGGFKWNSFNFMTYGATERTELAFSVVNVGAPATQNVALGLGYKTIIPLFRADEHQFLRERKLTIGQMLYVATSPNSATLRDRVGGWLYTHMSGRLASTKTRLTAGLSYGSSHVFGFRYAGQPYPYVSPDLPIKLIPNTPFCFIGGIEQPINKRVSLVVDWFSGRHDLAAVIPAIQLNLKKQVVILGYKRANDQQNDSNALVTELMFHF